MRRALAVETCLALMLAFLMAPFQHVHTGSDHADHEHAHLGVMHSHFFPIPAASKHRHGIQIEVDEDDDHAHAWSVDSFALTQPTGPALCLPAQCPLTAFVPDLTFAPLATVEYRAHDPPRLDTSVPRAPPL